MRVHTATSEVNMRPKSRGIGKLRVIVVSGMLLFIAAVAAGLWLRTRADAAYDSLDALRVALQSLGYHLVRPPRAEWLPGTVLYDDTSSCNVYLSS